MFNIFKKRQSANGTMTEAIRDVLLPSVRNKVERIHNEFETASDRALAEAQAIINSSVETKREELGLLLKDVGFINSKLAREVEARREKISMSKQRAEIIAKYAQKYPQYKFIFRDQVEEICKKYNLVCGEVDLYTGNVPEKNIREMVSFKVMEEDICHKIKSLHFTMIVSSWEVDVYKKTGYHSFIKAPFYICAPTSDMKIDSEKHTLKGAFISEIPDPIVLHYLPEGYLIVTKWGLEASDPLLVNEKDN
jgi:hypothetical protein